MSVVPVIGSDFLKALMAAGVVPNNARRVIIDLDVESAIKVYYETWADKEAIESKPVLDAVLELGLHIKGTEIKS
jgi:hypothetical protein